MNAQATQAVPCPVCSKRGCEGERSPQACPQIPRRQHAAAPRLWLALHLPRFPLETLGRQRSVDAALLAVTDGTGAASVVVAAGVDAATAGVHAGMPVGAACALVPNLQLAVRDEAAEAAALEGLAAWAGRFTSCVSLEPPDGLLLEIGASLALFGGLEALLERRGPT